MSGALKKQTLFLSVCLIILCNFPIQGQHAAVEVDTLRVIAESGSVYKLSLGKLSPVSEFGSNLDNGDEVITGPSGKAYILLSLLSDHDEVYMAPSSRVRLSRDGMASDTPIYIVDLLYGKIRAKTILNPGKQIRIQANSVEVVADEGEYIVESNNAGVNVGTVSGIVKMIATESNQSSYIPQKTMTRVSGNGFSGPVQGIAKELYAGVEKSEKEKIADPEALRIAYLKQEELKKAQQLLYEQQEREKARAQKEAELQRARELEALRKEKELEAARQAELAQMQQEEEALRAREEEEIKRMEAIEANQPSFFSKYKWHIAAGSTFLIFNWLATEEASSYNSLASENDSLNTQYYNATTSNQKALILADYAVNQEKMAQHKSTMERYNYIALAALIFEGYLIYDLIMDQKGDDELTFNAERTATHQLYVHSIGVSGDPAIQLQYQWKW